MQNDILAEADKIINGERQEQYGKPEDAFESIASLWNAYFISILKDLQSANNCFHAESWEGEFIIKAHDVAMMMVLLKVARTNGQKKIDNYIDIAGYAALAARL